MNILILTANETLFNMAERKGPVPCLAIEWEGTIDESDRDFLNGYQTYKEPRKERLEALWKEPPLLGGMNEAYSCFLRLLRDFTGRGTLEIKDIIQFDAPPNYTDEALTEILEDYLNERPGNRKPGFCVAPTIIISERKGKVRGITLLKESPILTDRGRAPFANGDERLLARKLAEHKPTKTNTLEKIKRIAESLKGIRHSPPPPVSPEWLELEKERLEHLEETLKFTETILRLKEELARPNTPQSTDRGAGGNELVILRGEPTEEILNGYQKMLEYSKEIEEVETPRKTQETIHFRKPDSHSFRGAVQKAPFLAETPRFFIGYTDPYYFIRIRESARKGSPYWILKPAPRPGTDK